MKKFLKFALLILAGAAIFAFAGCNEEDSGLTLGKVRSAYSSILQATTIEESYEIKRGELVQYEENKVYALEGDVYTVTGVKKELNKLEAGTTEPYTSTQFETTTVNKAEAFSGTIALEDVNIESTSVSEGTLTVSVKAGKENDFYKLTTLTEVSNMQAAFSINQSKLAEIVVTFNMGTSAATVTISFTY